MSGYLARLARRTLRTTSQVRSAAVPFGPVPAPGTEDVPARMPPRDAAGSPIEPAKAAGRPVTEHEAPSLTLAAETANPRPIDSAGVPIAVPAPTDPAKRAEIMSASSVPPAGIDARARSPQPRRRGANRAAPAGDEAGPTAGEAGSAAPRLPDAEFPLVRPHAKDLPARPPARAHGADASAAEWAPLPPQRERNHAGRVGSEPLRPPARPGPDATAGRRRTDDEESATVHVTIGRIEIAAVHQSAPAPRAPAIGARPMPLEDYLARRGRR